MKPKFGLSLKSPLVAIASTALVLAGMAPASAQVAAKGSARATPGATQHVQHRHHHHRGPRVSIGVGVGFGGFYDPFFDPYYPYGYPPYGGYVYAPQPAVPCTPADVPKSPPTNNIFSPDYAYDRIDANRCSPESIAAGAAAAAAPAPSGAQQPPAYYFCRGSNAYYPNVRECAGGWETVPGRPQ